MSSASLANLSETLAWLAVLSYVVAAVLFGLELAYRVRWVGVAGVAVTVAGLAANVGAAVARALAAHRVPWGNMYEFSVMVGIVTVTAFLVWVARRPAVRPLGVFVLLPDELAYRTTAFGFPIWTFAIIAGAIWAQAAWGRYWGWDPKETWSFISWTIFAAYLHARATAGWRGRRAVGLSAASVHERVHRLETRGVIRGYHAEVDPEVLGLEVLSLVSVVPSDSIDAAATEAGVAAIRQVETAYKVAGEDSYMLVVRSHSIAELSEVLQRLQAVDGVARTRTAVVLATPVQRGPVV